MKNKKQKLILGLSLLFLIFGFLSFFDFANAQDAQGLRQGRLPTQGSLFPKLTGATTGAATTLKGLGAAAGIAALKGGGWAIAILGFFVLLQHALWWFIGFGYSLLNSAVNAALDPNWFQIDTVLQGWRLVRDFVNIWFILILLFIAIGTILRIPSYQAKKLLLILILMALIVNFSMPISKLIIDVSNIISFQFLKAICPEIQEQAGIKYCDFASNLENGLDVKGFTQALKDSPTTSAPVTTTKPVSIGTTKTHAELPQLIPEAQAQTPLALGPILAIAARWIGTAVAFTAFEGISSYFTNTSYGGVSVGAFVSVLTTNIFLLFTAFVILALAILFLIRIVSLIFLVVLSPFGFAAMVLPATQKYSQMWWTYLFKQSFFAPFALFFLWMSLNLMNHMKLAFTTNGLPYDFTNPANGRLMFYIFSIILLYASLWVARKMGAIGAETIIKWGNLAKGAITGFVGGLAARRFVAPIGAAMTAAGLPERVGKRWWLGRALGGVKTKEFAEYLAKRGKAPEKAAEKAELGMRLAPAERAEYFAKLDRAAKEAMLNKMKAEERSGFISNLGTKNLAAAQEARAILRSRIFAPEERLKAGVEEFKYSYTLPEQWKKFGSQSVDIQRQFLLGIEDADKRAQFLDHVREEALKASDATSTKAFEDANAFLETNGVFSANQQYANRLARFKTEHNENQKINKLAEFFTNRPESEWKTRFRFAMNDSQRLDLIEYAKENKDMLQKLQGWVNEMDSADQDKLYRDTVGKRATADAVVSFINAIDVKKPDGTSDESRNLAIKKMVLSGASVAQLAKVAQASSAELRDEIDKIADAMGIQQRSDYYRRQGRPMPPPPRSPEGTPPPTTGGGPSSPPPSPVGPAPVPSVTSTPVSTTPVTPSSTTLIFEKINTIDPEDLEEIILNAAPRDLEISITKEIEINPKFQEAFIRSVTIDQLFGLINKTELIDAIKKSIKDNTLASQNKTLAFYISRLRSLPEEGLRDLDKELKAKLLD